MTNCPVGPWSPPLRGNSWWSRGSKSGALHGYSSLLHPWVHSNALPPTEAGPSVVGGGTYPPLTPVSLVLLLFSR